MFYPLLLHYYRTKITILTSETKVGYSIATSEILRRKDILKPRVSRCVLGGAFLVRIHRATFNAPQDRGKQP